MKLAYSYIRWSSPKQSSGDSLRRQTEATRRWCEESGYELAETYHDQGVSARRGRNRATGALGEFLRAVERGEIERGSVLVVERLDRLSRDQVHKAATLLFQVIEKGVGVVTLSDGRLYTEQTLDTTAVIVAVVELSAAHATNEARIARVQAAMDARRERVERGEVVGGRGPGWLSWNGSEWEINQSKTATLREIFRRYVEGESVTSIRRRLDERGALTMRGDENRPKTRWDDSSVRFLLRNEAVIGRYIPGKSVGRPGEPVDGYYPQIVAIDLWRKAQARYSRHSFRRGRRREVPSLLSSLCRCAECGAPVHVAYMNDRDAILRCRRTCSYSSLENRSAEMAVLALLRDRVSIEDIGEDGAERERLRERVGEIEGEIAEKERGIDLALEVSSVGNVSAERIARRVEKIEKEIERLQGELDESRRELAKLDGRGAGARAALSSVQEIVEKAGNEKDRPRLAAALRRVVERVELSLPIQQMRVILAGTHLSYLLTPVAERFRYEEEADVVRAIQIEIDDFDGEVYDHETELLGGNLIVDRAPVDERFNVRPEVEQIREGLLLIHPRRALTPAREMLSPGEASREIGVSQHTLRNWCKRGALPGAFQGLDRRWRIPRQALWNMKD